MAIYRKGQSEEGLRNRAEEQKEARDRNKVRNDSFNIGMIGTLDGGPTVDTLRMRHKMLGEERPISGAGLAEGIAEAKRYKAKRGE